ncbi:hypothetical protein [Microbacterium tumbae]
MPVLTYPETTIIGTTDVGRMAAFFSVFGAQPVRVSPIPRAAARVLYGIDAELSQIVLHEPGIDTTIRLIETPHSAPAFEPLKYGPYGIDYYTRDLALSMDILRAAGADRFSPLVGYGAEGNRNYELLFFGPDELGVFLTDTVATDQPWPTKLVDDPARTHSEVLMHVWVVKDAELERRFWTEEAGLLVVSGSDGDAWTNETHQEWNDEMQRLMYTPRNTPLHGINITDAGRHHKIELLDYPEETVTERPSWPLRGGFFAGAFYVDDLDQAKAGLPSATFSDTVVLDEGRGEKRAVTAMSPGCVRFELWER